MKKTTSQIGLEAEERTAAFLQEHGYEILARQYRCRGGELDLVAVKKGRRPEEHHLTFVEVKYRRTRDWGEPWEAVDYHKRCCISRAAGQFLQENPWKGSLSFDIAEVCGENMERIRYHRNAFCPPGW